MSWFFHFNSSTCLDIKCYYSLYSSSVSPIREVQLELILLQFVIPTLLEHSNTRAAIKASVKQWSILMARIL